MGSNLSQLANFDKNIQVIASSYSPNFLNFSKGLAQQVLEINKVKDEVLKWVEASGIKQLGNNLKWVDASGIKQLGDYLKLQTDKFKEVLLNLEIKAQKAWENLKALFKKSISKGKTFSTAWLTKKFELVEVLSPPDFLHLFIYLPSPKDFHFTYSFKSQAPPTLA